MNCLRNLREACFGEKRYLVPLRTFIPPTTTKMKFAKQLESQAMPHWRQYYVNYKGLKKVLKQIEKLRKENADAEVPHELVLETSARFLAELQNEIAKVNGLASERQAALAQQRASIEDLRRHAASCSDQKEAAELRKSAVAAERELWRGTSQLREFVELNYTAAYKAVKKHDKITRLHHMESVMAAIDAEPFLAILEQPASSASAGGLGNTSRNSQGISLSRSDHTPPPHHLQPVGSEASLHGLGSELVVRDGAVSRGSEGSQAILAATAAGAPLLRAASDASQTEAASPPRLRGAYVHSSSSIASAAPASPSSAIARQSSNSVASPSPSSHQAGGLTRAPSLAGIPTSLGAPAILRIRAEGRGGSTGSFVSDSSIGSVGGGRNTRDLAGNDDDTPVDTMVAAGIASLLQAHLGMAPQTPQLTSRPGTAASNATGSDRGDLTAGTSAAVDDVMPGLDLDAPAASSNEAVRDSSNAGSNSNSLIGTSGDQHLQEEANSDTAILSRLQSALSQRESEKRLKSKRSLAGAFGAVVAAQHLADSHALSAATSQQQQTPSSTLPLFSASGRLPTIAETEDATAQTAAAAGGSVGATPMSRGGDESADVSPIASASTAYGPASAQTSVGSESAGLRTLTDGDKASISGVTSAAVLMTPPRDASSEVSGGTGITPAGAIPVVTPSKSRPASAGSAAAAPSGSRTPASTAAAAQPRQRDRATSSFALAQQQQPSAAVVPLAVAASAAAAIGLGTTSSATASGGGGAGLLSPIASSSGLPAHLSWDSFDEELAGTMARQFDKCLRDGHEYTSAALKMVSPELINARNERLKRLARFTWAVIRAQKKIRRLVALRASLRQLHDAILAAKLELYRYMLKVIIREVELIFPEGAAALENLVQAHYSFFAMYMSDRVRTPTKHRIELWERLQGQGQEGGAAPAAAPSIRGGRGRAGSADSLYPSAVEGTGGSGSGSGRRKSSRASARLHTTSVPASGAGGSGGGGGTKQRPRSSSGRAEGHGKVKAKDDSHGAAATSGRARPNGLSLLHEVEHSTLTIGRVLKDQFLHKLAHFKPQQQHPQHAEESVLASGSATVPHRTAFSDPPSSPAVKPSAELVGSTVAAALSQSAGLAQQQQAVTALSTMQSPLSVSSVRSAPQAPSMSAAASAPASTYALTSPPVVPSAASVNPVLDSWHLPPSAAPSVIRSPSPDHRPGLGHRPEMARRFSWQEDGSGGPGSGPLSPPAQAPSSQLVVSRRSVFKLGKLFAVNRKRQAPAAATTGARVTPSVGAPSSAVGGAKTVSASSEERKATPLPVADVISASATTDVSGSASKRLRTTSPEPVQTGVFLSSAAAIASPAAGSGASIQSPGGNRRSMRAGSEYGGSSSSGAFSKLRIARDGSLMVMEQPQPQQQSAGASRSAVPSISRTSAALPTIDEHSALTGTASAAQRPLPPSSSAGLHHRHQATALVPDRYTSMYNFNQQPPQPHQLAAGKGVSSLEPPGGSDASLADLGLVSTVLSLQALDAGSSSSLAAQGSGNPSSSTGGGSSSHKRPLLSSGSGGTGRTRVGSDALGIDMGPLMSQMAAAASGASGESGVSSRRVMQRLPSARLLGRSETIGDIGLPLDGSDSAAAASVEPSQATVAAGRQSATDGHSAARSGASVAESGTGHDDVIAPLDDVDHHLHHHHDHDGDDDGQHSDGDAGGDGLSSAHSHSHRHSHHQLHLPPGLQSPPRTVVGGGEGGGGPGSVATKAGTVAPTSAAVVAQHQQQQQQADTASARAKYLLMYLLGVGEKDPFGQHHGGKDDALHRLGFSLPLGGGGVNSTVSGHIPEHGPTGPPAAYIARKAWVRWRPAMFEWLPEYKFRKYLWPDVLAGVTIGVLLLPQGLAYATLAGLPPIYGVYTGIPAILYALFGTSRHAAIGPMSIPALLIASGIASMGGPQGPPTGQAYVDAVMGMTLLCGALLLALGWLNMGFIVRFISRPVLSGFASASAVLTMCSAAKDLMGTDIPRSQVIYDYIPAIAAAVPRIHGPTFATGVIAILLLWRLPKFAYSKKMPAPLQVVAAFIAAFAIWWALPGASGGGGSTAAPVVNSAGVRLIGSVPAGFPSFRIPQLRREDLPSLMTTAVTVAFVGFIESIAVAKMYAVKHGYDIAPSSELKALGVTNVVGAMFGSFPVMGAFGRSAVNDNTGARSQLSGVVSALTVALLLLFVTPALFYLPNSVLAAVIIMAVSSLVDVSGARRLWAVDKRDFLTMMAAFVATLCLGVLLGVIVAMAFSLVLFIALTTQPTVEELGRVSGTVIYRHIGLVGVSKVPEVKVIKFLAPLFFANCTVLKDRLLLELVRRKELPPRLQWRALILCFASVSSIDSTSVQVLEEVLHECHAQRVPLIISSANAIVESVLQSTGFEDKLGGPRFMFRRVHEAVRAVLLQEVTSDDLPPNSRRLAAATAAAKAEAKKGKKAKRKGKSKKRSGGASPAAAGQRGSAAAASSGGILTRLRKRVLHLPLVRRARGLVGSHEIDSDSDDGAPELDDDTAEDVESHSVQKAAVPAASAGVDVTRESYEVIVLGHAFELPSASSLLARLGWGGGKPQHKAAAAAAPLKSVPAASPADSRPAVSALGQIELAPMNRNTAPPASANGVGMGAAAGTPAAAAGPNGVYGPHPHLPGLGTRMHARPSVASMTTVVAPPFDSPQGASLSSSSKRL